MQRTRGVEQLVQSNVHISFMIATLLKLVPLSVPCLAFSDCVCVFECSPQPFLDLPAVSDLFSPVSSWLVSCKGFSLLLHIGRGVDGWVVVGMLVKAYLASSVN